METKDLKYILIAVIVIIGAGAAVAYMNRPGANPESLTVPVPHKAETSTPATTTILTRDHQTEHDVIYNSKGFSPAVTTIKKGDIVKWISQTGGDLRIASNPHPTHTDYPGTNATKCGTPDGANMFDSCKSIKMGENWTFVFDNAGTWKYHNHMNPKDTAKIVVTE